MCMCYVCAVRTHTTIVCWYVDVIKLKVNIEGKFMDIVAKKCS